MSTFTPNEMMTIAAARALRNEDVCFVGIGAPSAACNLARLTHAPQLTLIYESGTIATKPNVLPLSIGDGELCDTALTTVPVPEMMLEKVSALSDRLKTTAPLLATVWPAVRLPVLPPLPICNVAPVARPLHSGCTP